MFASAQTSGVRQITLHPMLSELSTRSIASVSAQDANYVGRPLDLSLGDYNVNGGSINCGQDGTKFSFTVWPLSDALAAAFDGVVQQRGRICLHCCGEPVLLDLVSVERTEPQRVRIVGRIVGRAYEGSEIVQGAGAGSGRPSSLRRSARETPAAPRTPSTEGISAGWCARTRSARRDVVGGSRSTTSSDAQRSPSPCANSRNGVTAAAAPSRACDARAHRRLRRKISGGLNIVSLLFHSAGAA